MAEHPRLPGSPPWKVVPLGGTNQNKVRHGWSLMEPGEDALSLPARAMLLWNRLNVMAARFDEDHVAWRVCIRDHR